MNRTALVAPAAALALAGAFLLGGRSPRPAVAADPPAASDSVVVDGVGKVSGTPDVLRVTLGVSVVRGDVTSALGAASAAEDRLRRSLLRDGVAKPDLQTADVSVYPSYDGQGHRNGYSVSQTLTAKLRDLRRAGAVMSRAVAAGGREAVLQGVTFSLEDNKALLQQARVAAYDDARDRAAEYARLAGRALGAVQLVTESTAAPAQPFRSAAVPAAAAADGASVPIEAGSQQVSVSVTVRWALR